MMVRSKHSIPLALVAAFLFSTGTAAPVDPQVGIREPSRATIPAESREHTVIRVVDGDTIVVSPNEKVRLIGVDTPETVHPKKAVECYGKDAKQFTHDMIEGKSVRLVMDDVNQRTKHKDKYGRTLAYVYLDDGRMLNRELIRQGYAHAYTRFPFSHLGEFRELERNARANSMGLWASCPIE